MAAHSRAWDNTDPANSDSAGDGAQEIREFKTDVDERMSLDHHWNNSITDGAADQDGRHDKITMKEQAADPSFSTANTGVLYTKDDGSGNTELYFEDESGDVTKITEGTSVANAVSADFVTVAQTLQTPRAFSISGDGVAAAIDFDGSASVNLSLQVDQINLNGTWSGDKGKVYVYNTSVTTASWGLYFDFGMPTSNFTLGMPMLYNASEWKRLHILETGETAPASGIPYIDFTNSTNMRFYRNNYSAGAGTLIRLLIIYK